MPKNSIFKNIIHQLKNASSGILNQEDFIGDSPWAYKNQMVRENGEYPCDINHIHFELNEKSKVLYSQGRKSQGYIGVANLQNGEVHLFPCFNLPMSELDNLQKAADLTDNQMLQPSTLSIREKAAEEIYFSDQRYTFNKFNHPFSYNNNTENCIIKLANPLGTNTGRAHELALQCAGLEHDNRDKFIGFGIFKGIDSELIYEFRDRSANLNYNSILYNQALLKTQETNEHKTNTKELKKNRLRSLPQELSDLLLNCLLEQLPLDEGKTRTLKRDHRFKNLHYPLYHATQKGDIQKVKWLLRNHYNINEISSSNEESCFMAAFREGDFELIRTLLTDRNLKILSSELPKIFANPNIKILSYLLIFLNHEENEESLKEIINFLNSSNLIEKMIFQLEDRIEELDIDLLVLNECMHGIRDQFLGSYDFNLIGSKDETDFLVLYQNAKIIYDSIEKLLTSDMLINHSHTLTNNSDISTSNLDQEAISKFEKLNGSLPKIANHLDEIKEKMDSKNKLKK